MPKISVIVPVYKVEKYLKKCVESILDQTYGDLEIILVDDGSPDGCPAICDEYAARDPRVRVIHKVNGGLSSARNAGLAVATGQYVGFVDSDDYILPEMYEKLLAALTAAQADISICNYVYVDEQTGAVDGSMQALSPIKDQVLSREQALEKLSPAVNGYSFYVTAWNKLYKRELFDGLRFPEGRVHEDEFTVHHVFDRCGRVASVSDVLYRYVQRGGSIMSGGASVRSLDAVYALHDRYVFFRRKGLRRAARASLLAAEWKLRTLLGHLPVSARGAERKAIRLLLPALLGNCCPEAGQLLKAWLQTRKDKKHV